MWYNIEESILVAKLGGKLYMAGNYVIEFGGINSHLAYTF